MQDAPTIDDIRAAAKRIEGAVVRTPMLKSRTLSEIIGAEVWLKFENLQFTAAYKERGALNKLLQLTPEERARERSDARRAKAIARRRWRLKQREKHRAARPEPGPSATPAERSAGTRKVLIHINNTNPILDEDSPQRALLARQGIEVAHDGLQLAL